jgi:hypothetical protein
MQAGEVVMLIVESALGYVRIIYISPLVGSTKCLKCFLCW